MSRRIAMISEHASPMGALGGVDGGGQNVYVGQLAVELVRRGYEVDVFTRRDDASLPRIVCWRDGVRIVHVPAGPASYVRKEDLLPYMAEFAAFMRTHWLELGGYDLVHANFWTSGVVASELKRGLGVPFVITFHALGKIRRLHQAEADAFPEERQCIEESLVAEADRIIAECPQDRDDLLEHYGADATKIDVVPCGVDMRELSPESMAEARAHTGIAASEQVILQLGRLVPRKGIDNVVRALERLQRRHDLAPRLVVVGGESALPDEVATPEIARLQAVARSEGVEDRVTFAGARPRSELRHYYASADVFVTTPWYEPFGMTPLEAMACARPVIGSEVGGIKYSIEQGKTGILVPPQDPDALTDALALLLHNRSLAESMGRNGLTRVRRHFTWPLVADAIARVYEDVLAGHERTTIHAKASPIRRLDAGFRGNVEAMLRSRRLLRDDLLSTARLISRCFAGGSKLLICGNGGSAADAQHFASEFVGRFQVDGRRALPAIALTADSAFLTAWSNDVAYDDVFVRQVAALGAPGDVLVGISTSGSSPNVVRAFEAASAAGMQSVALTGASGGALAGLADVALRVPAKETPRIQEVHSLLIHLICQLVEDEIVSLDAVEIEQAECAAATRANVIERGSRIEETVT